jgi:hypothetical protein
MAPVADFLQQEARPSDAIEKAGIAKVHRRFWRVGLGVCPRTANASHHDQEHARETFGHPAPPPPELVAPYVSKLIPLRSLVKRKIRISLIIRGDE